MSEDEIDNEDASVEKKNSFLRFVEKRRFFAKAFILVFVTLVGFLLLIKHTYTIYHVQLESSSARAQSKIDFRFHSFAYKFKLLHCREVRHSGAKE